MAIGARKAFQEFPNEPDRERRLAIPYLGCDGVAKTGQSWVRSGLLTAMIVIPQYPTGDGDARGCLGQ
jgi:ribose transport system substrate-binding protein